MLLHLYVGKQYHQHLFVVGMLFALHASGTRRCGYLMANKTQTRSKYVAMLILIIIVISVLVNNVTRWLLVLCTKGLTAANINIAILDVARLSAPLD
jgi:hypothetical protein